MLRRALIALAIALALAAPAAAVTDQRFNIALETAGVRVEVWVVFPDGYDAAKPIPTLLVFPPGVQDLFMVDYSFNWWVPEATRRGWLVIGAASPPGQGFATAGRHLILPLLDALAARFPVENGTFHLAGIQAGGTTAFAAALDHPDRFRSLTVIGGAPPNAAENANVGRLARMPISMFVGRDDPALFAPMTATYEALVRAGIAPHFAPAPSNSQEMLRLRGEGARPLFDLMEPR